MKKGSYRGVAVIATAAVLLELISLVQYYYTHRILEDVLEEHVLSELTIKALRTRSILMDKETTLRNHQWYAERYLHEADTMPVIVRQLVELNSDILGAAAFFVPDFYPAKGRLYEPYARRRDSTVTVGQIASHHHDYTTSEFYAACMAGDTLKWTKPYFDSEGAGCKVITYIQPLCGPDGQPVGGIGIDLSIDWIGDIMNHRHIYPSSYDLCFTEEFSLVAAPPADSVSSEKVAQVVALVNDSTVSRQLTRNGRSTTFSFDDPDGRRATVYYARMRAAPHWQVAVVCYDDEVYSELYNVRLRILALSFIGLLLLGYILWRTARSANRLHQADRERDRIASELRIAKAIQTEMLPATGTFYQERGDVAVCASLVPAKEVGGDLFDHFIRDEKLYFCIGDVSGKGVPAAIVMAVVHSLFRMATVHENSPARIMQTINAVLCQKNRTNMFVTMFIGVLDLPTGHLRYCNAGHDRPVIVGKGEVDAAANLPVGLFDNFTYVQQLTTLQGGDLLFLYTDGLTEAMNPAHRQFTRKRLNDVLAGAHTLAPAEVLARVDSAVSRFTEGAEQSDDLTMMAVSYTPRQEQAAIDDLLTLKNDLRQVRQLNAFVKSLTGRIGMEPSLAKKLQLAVEEAVVNVMDYAYPAGTEGDITVRATYDGRRLKLVIADAGVKFDPTQKAKADTTLSAEERPIGGLGILLVRELMDTINYERTDGHNVLTLSKKYIKPQESNDNHHENDN